MDLKPNPKHKGEVSELAIALELVKRGISVSKPMGDNQRYDLIIDANDRLYKVQCETGSYNNTSIHFSPCSVRINANGYFIKGYRGDVDLFAVHCPKLDKVWIIPVDICGQRSQAIRFKDLSTQKRGNNIFSEDYEIDRWIEKFLTK